MFFSPSFRSIFYAVGFIEFLDPRHDGCPISIDIFMCIANVLAVHLSWASAKWAQIFNILFTKIDCYTTDVVVCNCACNMGKIQRTTWSNL